MVFRYLGVILSNYIWYNQIAEPWQHLNTRPRSLKLIVMGFDLKTVFTQPALSHLWEYWPVLVPFFCPLETVPGGVKDQQKCGSNHLFLVQVWFHACIAAELRAVSPTSVLPRLIIPYVRAIKGRTQQSSMRGKTIRQKAKISYSF